MLAINDQAAIAAVLVIFLLVGYPVPEYSKNRILKFFHAYKISSGSMCPTICEDERVVAAADAYKLHSPERADLIVFDFEHSGTIFPKRVIGVAGTWSHPARQIRFSRSATQAWPRCSQPVLKQRGVTAAAAPEAHQQATSSRAKLPTRLRPQTSR